MKGEKTKKPNKNLVDKYCVLRSEINALNEAEKLLRPKILNEFEALDVSELAGHNGYAVKMVVSNIYTVNPVKLFRRILPRDFLSCVSVSVKKAEDFLSRADVLKMSVSTERGSLKVQL